MILGILVMIAILAWCSTTDTYTTKPNTSHTHVIINNLAQWSIRHTIQESHHYLETSGTIIWPTQSWSWFLSGRRNGQTLTDHTTVWTIPSWLYASWLHRIVQYNDHLLAILNDDAQRAHASTQQTLNRRNRPIITQTVYTLIPHSGHKTRSTTGIWWWREADPCMIQVVNDQRTLACSDKARHLTLTRDSQAQAITAGSRIRNERFVHDIVWSRQRKSNQTTLTITGLLRIPWLSLSVPITMTQTTKKQETDHQKIIFPDAREPRPRRLREQIHRHTP